MNQPWDENDIQEHDEMMRELETCSDGELVALLEDDDRDSLPPMFVETHGYALACVYPEEIQTEIDRRLCCFEEGKCPSCDGYGEAGGCPLCAEPL